MKTTDILAALEGVKLIKTIPGNMEYLLPAIAAIVCTVLALVMVRYAHESGAPFCVAATIVFSVIALALGGLTIHETLSDKSATKYVVEVAEELPENSKMILMQNFRTIEVEGNTYTMVKR